MTPSTACIKARVDVAMAGGWRELCVCVCACVQHGQIERHTLLKILRVLSDTLQIHEMKVTMSDQPMLHFMKK